MNSKPVAPRAVIFDCDGTLTDSMPLHYQAWKQTIEAHGGEFPEHRFYELAGIPSRKVAAVIAKENKIELDLDEVVAQREQAFEQLAGQIQGHEPIIRLADEYRQTVPIAVGSGSLRESVKSQLSGLGILDWFSVLVCAEDTERHKPEPDVFLKAAESMQVAPEDCIVYEDGDLGIEAAQRAGMSAIDVRPILANWHNG